MREGLKIFGLGDSLPYAKQVCEHLGERIGQHEESYFDDGECYVRSEENVRGADCFVICSLYNSVTERLADKVIKLLFFIGALRDASADRITLVFPYMAYQRQDRKNKSRAPIYTKYFPQILESMTHPGDRILTIDPHNLSAFQSGNRMVNDHLEGKNLLSEELAEIVKINNIDRDKICILSPDEGGVKRVRFFRDKLADLLGKKKEEVSLAYVDKTHENDGTIQGNKIIGNVEGKIVFTFDDMISSAKTMWEAYNACKNAGGTLHSICATHSLCVGVADDYITKILDAGVKVLVTDTVEPLRLSVETTKRLSIISTVPLIAEGIRCTHNSESISRLLH